MSSARRYLWLGSVVGFATIGAGWWSVGSVPLAICGAGLCAALRRPGALGVGCLLLCSALAEAGRGVGSKPDPGRVAEVVARPRSHWQRAENGYSLSVEVLHYRQGGAVVHWRAPVVVSIEDDDATRAPPPVAALLRIKGYVRESVVRHNFGVRPRAGRYRLNVRHRALLHPITERSLTGSFWRVSSAARRRIERGLGGDEAVRDPPAERAGAVFRALVLGDPGALPDVWFPALKRTGTVHVLAVSGLHVGLVLLLVVRAAGGLGAWTRFLLGCTLLGFYLVLVGPRPSLVRAAVMGAAGLLSLGAERPRAVGPALAAAVWILVASDPEIVRELGFQLTVAATASIVLASRGLEALGALGRSPWARRLVAGGAAQIGTLPMLLPKTGLVAMWAPAFNLVAIPWAAGSLAASWVWLGLGLDATAVGRGWRTVVEVWALGPDVLAWLPPHVLAARLGRPDVASLGALAVAAGTILLRCPAVLGGRRWIGVVLCSVGTIAICRGMVAAPIDQQSIPELILLDVGQGDAILLRDGDSAVLIDGGGWPHGDIAATVLAPALAAIGVSRLDALVPTHGDRDHCGGLLGLSRLVDVGRVWLPPGWSAAKCSRDLGLAVRSPARFLWRGRRRAVGRWRLSVMWPPPRAPAADNRHSLVLVAEVHGRRVLLTGDLDRSAELEILELEGSSDLSVDLLKLAHHGSATSTSESWLERTRPAVALASMGRHNPYRHPAAVVVERLKRRGIPLIRTDLAGAIRVSFPSDGPWRIESAAPAGRLE